MMSITLARRTIPTPMIRRIRRSIRVPIPTPMRSMMIPFNSELSIQILTTTETLGMHNSMLESIYSIVDGMEQTVINLH